MIDQTCNFLKIQDNSKSFQQRLHLNFDLTIGLPLIIPKAIAWAQQQESEILASGMALKEDDFTLARQVGVEHPERIRLALGFQLPLPSDPLLRQAALQTGLLSSNTVGLTLGYGIYILNGYRTARIFSHECRHVQQYEQAGSIAEYLPKYLRQIVQFGYAYAPYELDARAHEATS